MSVKLYAIVQRAQQQCPALGGWEPVEWKRQLPPPPGVLRSLGAVLNDLHTIMLSKKTSKNLKPSPLPGVPNVGEEISDRVAEYTRPKSLDEEGPKRFAC
jgi:hypothetical protein